MATLTLRNTKGSPLTYTELDANFTNLNTGLGGVINVKDPAYGATGDGVTDDLTAIQAALTAATAGQTVYFPAGTYSISNILALTSNNVRIVGDGDGTVLQFDNSSDPYDTNVYGNGRVGMLNILADGVKVQNMKFDQNFRNSGRVDGNTARVACLYLGAAGTTGTVNDISVSNCTFYDIYGDGVAGFATTTNSIDISHNHFVTTYDVQGWSSAGTSGEQCISFGAGNRIVVSDNIIEAALDDAIAIHGGCFDVVVRGNVISTTGGRILVDDSKRVSVTGNVINYIQDGASAITVNKEDTQSGAGDPNDFVLVSGNIISVLTGVTANVGINLTGPGDNVTIDGNQITTVDTQGIGILLSSEENSGNSTYYGGSQITISNNHIHNWTTGISITEDQNPELSLDVHVFGNTIYGATTAITASGFQSSRHPMFGKNRYIGCTAITTTNGFYFYRDAMDRAVLSKTNITAATTVNLETPGELEGFYAKDAGRVMGWFLRWDQAPTNSNINFRLLNNAAGTEDTYRLDIGDTDLDIEDFTGTAFNFSAGDTINVQADPVGTVDNIVNAYVEIYYIMEDDD